MNRCSRVVERCVGVALACAFALTASACAAPDAHSAASPVAATDSIAQAESPAPGAAPEAPPPGSGKPRRFNARTGGPLPPRRVPEPVQLDRSCRSDADCAVKDVGSCCGRHPDCVNVASPADPGAVRAQCAKQGLVSSCAIREITACACRQGQCAAADDAGVVP